jgi:hypothetical protein
LVELVKISALGGGEEELDFAGGDCGFGGIERGHGEGVFANCNLVVIYFVVGNGMESLEWMR